MPQQQQGSKAKGRKIGRNAKRPSQKRYVLEDRCSKNKRKHEIQEEMRQNKWAYTPWKTKHGTARALRRMKFNSNYDRAVG